MSWMRPEIEALVRYSPGLPIEEVMLRFGLSDVVKLASNENPEAPFPEVSEAIAEAATGVNRYPDSGCVELGRALSEATGIDQASLWFGGGSSDLLNAVARSVGGPGTSTVYGWPSFALYPINALLSGSEPIAVPLDGDHRYDVAALGAAVRDDTTLVLVCNPNNPTGTHVPGSAVAELIEMIPDSCLVVVDEAYAEYAVASDYESMIPVALERDNVVVARTFSKMYGLAGLRVGYMVGRPDTLANLQKGQLPFTVNNLAQIAAIASLRFPDRVAERVKANRSGVEFLEAALRERGIDHAPSQTNFVWLHTDGLADDVALAFNQQGVIVRPLSDEWTRVTVGTPGENERFVAALDVILGSE